MWKQCCLFYNKVIKGIYYVNESHCVPYRMALAAAFQGFQYLFKGNKLLELRRSYQNEALHKQQRVAVPKGLGHDFRQVEHFPSLFSVCQWLRPAAQHSSRFVEMNLRSCVSV